MKTINPLDFIFTILASVSVGLQQKYSTVFLEL